MQPRWGEIVRYPRRNDLLAAACLHFYVLYPWRGREVLCEGDVLPYYEYRSPAVLTDGEWIRQLGGPDAPLHPVWTQPLYEMP